MLFTIFVVSDKEKKFRSANCFNCHFCLYQTRPQVVETDMQYGFRLSIFSTIKASIEDTGLQLYVHKGKTGFSRILADFPCISYKM